MRGVPPTGRDGGHALAGVGATAGVADRPGGWQGCLVAWPDGIRGLILLSEAWWAAPCGGGEPPTKVGGLREDILFKPKEYPLALPKKDCQGGWRRHKLHIPRRCPEGTGSLIPLLLLFPPQNFAVGALYFPPDNPLETTKGEACGPLLWKPLGGWTGDGRRGTRHAVPRAWPPPTKFRAEIWGVGQGRCALRVGAEGPINHPSQPAHSGAIAAAGAREGWKSARGASPKGIAATSTG